MKYFVLFLMLPLWLCAQVDVPSDTVKWKFNTDMSIWSSPAMTPDGNIVVGNWRNKVYCLSPQGERVWARSTKKQIFGIPAVDSDGTIYVPSQNLVAFDADGNQKWQFHTANVIFSSPALMDDFVVITADSMLHVLDKDSGTVAWEYQLMHKSGPYRNQCSPVVAEDGTIYVGAQDDTLYAFSLQASDLYHDSEDTTDTYNPESAVKWKFPGIGELNSSPAIDSDGTLYVGSYDNNLYAIHPNGTKKWEFPTGDWVVSAPAIDVDGTIYFGSIDSTLYALYPDGTEKWQHFTDSWLTSSPAIGNDGIIYFGSESDFPVYQIIEDSSLFESADSVVAINDSTFEYYALDSIRTQVLKGVNPDGSLNFMYRTDGELRSSPMVGYDSTVYIGCYDFNLYAFRSTSTGLADSPWPCARGNARRSGRAGEEVNIPVFVQKPLLPHNFVLHQNYPNPFNPSTTIRIDLDHTAFTEMLIYNSLGQWVRTLYDGELTQGTHEIIWNAENQQGIAVSSGVYLLAVRMNGQQQIRKMMLIR